VRSITWWFIDGMGVALTFEALEGKTGPPANRSSSLSESDMVRKSWRLGSLGAVNWGAGTACWRLRSLGTVQVARIVLQRLGGSEARALEGCSAWVSWRERRRGGRTCEYTSRRGILSSCLFFVASPRTLHFFTRQFNRTRSQWCLSLSSPLS